MKTYQIFEENEKNKLEKSFYYNLINSNQIKYTLINNKNSINDYSLIFFQFLDII